MKTSDWIICSALALQSFHTITNAQAPTTKDQDTEKVCLDMHNTVRHAAGTQELTWDLTLFKKSMDLAGYQAQLTEADKKTCAVLTGESWTTIFTQFISDLQEIKKLSPDWTYTTAVSKQFEATTMAIWFTHSKVGCAVRDTQRVCCYDTIGNTLNGNIIMPSINATSIVNGVLTAALPQPVQAITSVDQAVTAAGGATTTYLQGQVTKTTNNIIGKINPFGRR